MLFNFHIFIEFVANFIFMGILVIDTYMNL